MNDVSPDPTPDADGYPTDETLDRIKEWPITENGDFGAAMDFAGRAWASYGTWACDSEWSDPDWPSYPKRVYRFATGGWSGNESIVSAIEANAMLQMVGAWSWRRGGQYEYRFPIVTDGVATAARLSEPEEERMTRPVTMPPLVAVIEAIESDMSVAAAAAQAVVATFEDEVERGGAEEPARTFDAIVHLRYVLTRRSRWSGASGNTGHAHSERQDCDETCPAWPTEHRTITLADLALAVARDGEFDAADEEDEAFAERLWSFLPGGAGLARPSKEALRRPPTTDEEALMLTVREHYERTVGTNGA